MNEPRPLVGPVYAWAVAILLLALALRLYALGGQSLWLDEAHTWWLAQLPWDDSLSALLNVGVHPPLYFMGEKLLTQQLGDSEWALRIFAVFSDMLAVACAMQIGRLVGGRAGWQAGGWFWAFQPMTIWYAREARPYALAAWLAALLLVLFLKLQGRSARVWWITAGVVMALGLLTHFFFALVSAALLLWTISDLRRARTFFRRWAGLTLLASIPLGLWLLKYFQLAQPTLGIGWIARPAVTELAGTVWNLFSGFGGDNGAVSIVLFGAVVLTLVVAGVLRDDNRRWARRALVWGVVFTLGVVWLVSQRRPIYVDRYFIILLPFVVIMLGRGTQVIAPWAQAASTRWEPRSLMSVMVAVGALGLGLWTGAQIIFDATFAREDWRALAEVLIVQAGERPVVWLADPESVVPLRYYYRREFQVRNQDHTSLCQTGCWYVLRQPYTATHAFSQSVADRIWQPAIPEGCHIETRWASPTGLAAWQLRCS